MTSDDLQTLRNQNEALHRLVAKLSAELERERNEGDKLAVLITEKDSSLQQLTTGLHEASQQRFILGERYHALAGHLGESISIVDKSGHYVYANEKAARLHDLQAVDMVGRHVSDILGNDYGRWYINEIFTPVITSGVSFRSSKHFFKDNHSVLLGFQVKPLWDESGQVIGVLNVTYDETTRKNKQEHTQIEQGINLLSSFSGGLERTILDVFGLMCLVDTVTVAGIYLHDEVKKVFHLICHRNLPADFLKKVRTCDSSSPEYTLAMRGVPWYDVIDVFPTQVVQMLRPVGVDHLAIIPMVHEHIINGCLVIGIGIATAFADADRIFFESIAWRISNIVALFNAQKRLHSTHAELTATVSDLRQRQQLLISQSKMQSLGELSAGMAHEINQPLVIISLAVGNILHKLEAGQRLPETYLSEKFESVMHNLQRIRHILDDIRTFARDEGGILIDRINVRETMAVAISAFRTRCVAGGVRLTSRIDPGDIEVVGNRFKLEQVIANLLSNAYDAVMEKPAIEGTDLPLRSIRLRAARKGDRILVSISDNGIGIAPKHIHRLFTPFFTTKPEGAGTGLGLPIAYGIVTDMGGEITVNSTPGKGSTFVVSLPAV